MELNMLKAKIHRASVTEADLHYEGSITVDPVLLQESGILEYEQVDVLNITNGERFTTYTISGEANDGKICINGAAARLAQVGDMVIICAYVRMEEQEAKNFKPKIVLVDSDNKIESSYNGRIAA